jgi:RNA polymerase sigma factor (sigma-70 family)
MSKRTREKKSAKPQQPPKRDELSELLEMLDDRERTIIFKRFGLDDSKPKTLEEVGKKFGVTRERIRQLQNIALAKLRRALAKREKPIVRRDQIQLSSCT